MVDMGHARVSWARAQGPQSPGRGKRPGGFDPEELFGAAWWLTRIAKVAAQQTGVRACVPVVTTRKSAYSSAEIFCLLTSEAIEWFGVGHVRTAVKVPTDRVRRINLFGNTGVAVGHSSILMRSRSLIPSK
jgi:hypothetical protein